MGFSFLGEDQDGVFISWGRLGWGLSVSAMPSIQRHGRWRSTKTVVEYIEAGRQFADSAVNVLFEF